MSLNFLHRFDELNSLYSFVWMVFALATVVLFVWILVCFSKAKGLKKHPSAICINEMAEFFRTADKTEQGNLNKLFDIMTKTKNDVALIFHLYCRIYSNFSYIEHYLNYKFYKKLNTKRKPWNFNLFIVVMLLLSLMFSFSHWIGLENLFIENHFFKKENFELKKLLFALSVPLGYILVWSVFRILLIIKFKMYWIEFQNKFKKITSSCGEFFNSQEADFEEFADKTLTMLSPEGAIKHRIERIIARTDPSTVNLKPYTVPTVRTKKDIKPEDKEIKENATDLAETEPAPVVKVSAPEPPKAPDPAVSVSFAPAPPMPGVQVLKPHPESSAFMQAQAQMTNQLMQMMMQQSMQQTQLMQRALTSQQALADRVIQQNIMAMRLDAQTSALNRTDLPHINEPKFVWETPKPTVPEPSAAASVEPPKTEEPIKPTMEKVPDVKPDEKPPTNKADENSKSDEEKNLSKLLIQTFEKMSPKSSTSTEPTPEFTKPDREVLNIEERLGSFFGGTAYWYDETAQAKG